MTAEYKPKVPLIADLKINVSTLLFMTDMLYKCLCRVLYDSCYKILLVKLERLLWSKPVHLYRKLILSEFLITFTVN